MDTNKHKEFLIVGFGVVGLSLSKHLLDKHQSFDVVADLQPKASLVSGGLLNPVSLKRLKLAWNAPLFHSYAIDFYKGFTPLLKKEFIQGIPIMRIFSSIEEQNHWFSQSKNNQISSYLSDQLVSLKNIRNHYQASSVLDSYLIQLTSLVNDFSSFLINRNEFITSSFDYSSLIVSDKLFQYNGTTYNHVIFADGYNVTENPFFNYLPIYGNKGDYLIVRIPDLPSNQIYKSSKFLIPLGGQLFKFGATYERHFNDAFISDEAQISLSSELDRLLEFNYEIVSQVSGIRPTSKDRFPVSGAHPNHPCMFALNAMGSRGIMSSPWLANNLIESIIENKDILKEANLQRFTKKHFRFSSSLDCS